MTIQLNRDIRSYEIPGIEHKTLAGPEHGVAGFEIWEQWIAAGETTPVHRHVCEEVIVSLSGRGEVIIDGERTEFGPDTTLRVPADAVHQVNNIGDEVLHLVATLGMSPVAVRTADNQVMALPWQQ